MTATITYVTPADLTALAARVASLETTGGTIASRLGALEAAVKALTLPVPPVIPPVVPPAGVTYYRTDFSDGTLGPLVFYSYNGTGGWTASTDYLEPGSARSIKCTIPGTKTDDAAALCAWFGHGGLLTGPLDPTLDQDLFQQVRFVLGPGAIASVGGLACTPANATSQFKVHKSVYGQVGSNTNGWVMSSVGPCDHAGLASMAELYIGGTPHGWPPVVEGQVYDVVYRYHRYPALNVGTMAVWVNGTLMFESAKAGWWGDRKGSTQGLCLQDGAVYLQSPKGPLSVYVLFTQATSFPIGAGVASL